jgi:hypothetical protein
VQCTHVLDDIACQAGEAIKLLLLHFKQRADDLGYTPPGTKTRSGSGQHNDGDAIISTERGENLL